MANSLQQVEIEGRVIWVEVANLDTADSRPSPRFVNTSAGAADAATTALAKVNMADTLQTLITPVYKALKAIGPDEANVELTLGFGVKGDLFVAKGEGNASLKVSAKWKFESKPA